MVREAYPPQTRALRKGRYAFPINLPTSLPAGETAQITGATAATRRNNLQAAINGNGDKYIVINGDCRGGLTTITGENSTNAERFLIAGTDCWMPGLFMFGAKRWRLSVDPSKSTWMRWGEQRFRPLGKVGGSLTLVDTDDVIIDRWRAASAGSTFCVYYNTRNNKVRNTHWQRGRFSNNANSPREGVIIARPASVYDMIGGTGTFSNPDFSNFWPLESVNCTIRECDFLDAPDPYQNVAQAHGAHGRARYEQSHASYLDDEGFTLIGCDFYSRARQSANHSRLSENTGADWKNGSLNPDNPCQQVDCRHFGQRIGYWRSPGVAESFPAGTSRFLDDPGVATAGHFHECDNVYMNKCIVFDCNRAFVMADEGGANTGTIDCLIHHGVTRREGAVVDRINVPISEDNINFTCAYILYKTGGHPDNGRSKCVRTGILHNPRAFALTEIDPLDLVDSVVLNCDVHGAWASEISASGNVSDRGDFPGSTQVDLATTLAQMQSLFVQTFDPDNIEDPDAFITWELEKALLPASIAPEDYIWVIGNEDTEGGPPTDGGGAGGGSGSSGGVFYIPVASVSGSPGLNGTALGNTIDGKTGDGEDERWSALPANGIGPIARWEFGGAYNVLYMETWWSWGAARQSKYQLYAVDANGDGHFLGLHLSEQRTGFQRFDVNRTNIVAVYLVGFGTEINGEFNNDFTSINEVRFAANGVDVGDNNPPQLEDRQIVLQAGQAEQETVLAETDEDGDTLTYSIAERPDFDIADVAVFGSRIIFYPAQNPGTTKARVLVSDGKGLANSTAVAEWEIIVEAGNRPPVWSDPFLTMQPGETTDVDLRNYVSDADGDTINFGIATLPNNATGEILADGYTLRINALSPGIGGLRTEANDGVNAPVTKLWGFEVVEAGDVEVDSCVIEGLPTI